MRHRCCVRRSATRPASQAASVSYRFRRKSKQQSIWTALHWESFPVRAVFFCAMLHILPVLSNNIHLELVVPWSNAMIYFIECLLYIFYAYCIFPNWEASPFFCSVNHLCNTFYNSILPASFYSGSFKPGKFLENIPLMSYSMPSFSRTFKRDSIYFPQFTD